MSDIAVKGEKPLSVQEQEIEENICEMYKDRSIEELGEMLTNNVVDSFKLFIEEGAIAIAMKARLPHGEFRNWLNEQFVGNYSARRATDAMRFARAAYPHRQKLQDVGMSKNKFGLLIKLEDNVLQKALDEFELEGKPLDEVTNKDIQDILVRQNASERLKDKKIKELEEENDQLKENIEAGTEQIEELKDENDLLKQPARLRAEQMREVDEAISQINYQLELLKGYELNLDEYEPRLSQLTVSVDGLGKIWKSK